MRRYSPAYLLGQAFKGLWRNGVMSLASIIVLMSCLIVMGTFGLIVHNINNNLGTIGDINEITVFIDVDKTEEQTLIIKEKIESLGHVKSSRYLSKTDALEEMKETYQKDYPFFFEDIEAGIFPASFVLTCDSPENFNDLIEELRTMMKPEIPVETVPETVPADPVEETAAPVPEPGAITGEEANAEGADPSSAAPETPETQQETDENKEEYELFKAEAIKDCITKISYVKDVAEKLQSIKNGVIYVFTWFMAILFFVSLFVIINTIKLAVSYRKQEISIMRYVGATNWFIMMPFIFEGIIIGLVSSISAYFIQKLLYGFIKGWLGEGDLNVQVIKLVDFSEVKFIILGAFVGIGVITGIIGSSISLRKNLKA